LSTPRTHEQFDRFAESRPASGRPFGLALALASAVFGSARVWRGGAPRWWALGISAVLLIAALARPSWLEKPAMVWMKLVRPLNQVMTWVLMGLLFVFVILPAGLIRRWAVKDPLRLRIDPEAPTYWQERRPPGPRPESMANQF
jgi:hypothetical protein